MSNHLISIYLIPDVIVEDSEYARLLAQYPGVSHDGVNRIFPICLPDAVNPVLFEEVEGVDSMLAFGSLLFADDRAIHGEQSILGTLHTHPMWRVWCGQYETVAELEVDYNVVFSEPLDTNLTLSELLANVRIQIKTFFGG